MKIRTCEKPRLELYQLKNVYFTSSLQGQLIFQKVASEKQLNLVSRLLLFVFCTEDKAVQLGITGFFRAGLNIEHHLGRAGQGLGLK